MTQKIESFTCYAFQADANLAPDEFIGNDGPSGGYPYVTNRLNSIELFTTPSKARQWLGTSIKMYPNAKIVKIEVFVTPISDTDLYESIRQEALKKLTAEEIAVLGIK